MKPENIEQYFSRPDTPAKDSPVGTLMLRIIAKNPGMGVEEARTDANALLEAAAGRKVYRVPRVLSPEEKAQQTERLRTAFKSLPLAA